MSATAEAREIQSRPESITKARQIIHAPEAFTKRAVRSATAFIAASAEATDEDRFWADAAA